VSTGENLIDSCDGLVAEIANADAAVRDIQLLIREADEFE